MDGLEWARKCIPPPQPQFDSRTVQPKANRYTDYAITAMMMMMMMMMVIIIIIIIIITEMTVMMTNNDYTHYFESSFVLPVFFFVSIHVEHLT